MTLNTEAMRGSLWAVSRVHEERPPIEQERPPLQPARRYPADTESPDKKHGQTRAHGGQAAQIWSCLPLLGTTTIHTRETESVAGRHRLLSGQQKMKSSTVVRIRPCRDEEAQPADARCDCSNQRGDGIDPLLEMLPLPGAVGALSAIYSCTIL